VASTRPLHSVDEFDKWFAENQADGQGYAEVASDDSGYPFLTFSFRGSAAVVHWFPSPEQVLLLVGDAVVGKGDALDFQVQDGVCPFSDRFISGVDRARRIAGEVLGAGSTDGLGACEPL
jgi:hypothetical protein